MQIIRSVLYYSTYLLLAALNGFFLYRLCRGFTAVKEKRLLKILLYITLTLTSCMIIWIGDNNFAMTLPFYMAGFLIATAGDILGRITVGGLFFCFIMSVCAIADNFLIPLNRFGAYGFFTQLARPLMFGLFYLLFSRHIKKTIKLPHRLWKLCAALTILPFAVLSVLILPAYWMPESVLLDSLNLFQGSVILPLSLLSSVVLLSSILVLADYETKAQAAALAEMREVYYQGLQREQTQVRTLRHDLRNHLTAVSGLLEQDETEKAYRYIQELTDSQALHGSQRMCENEIVNVVVSSKCKEMEQCGIAADIKINLPPVLPMADTDLCALFGNALDNAVEAARMSGEKRVSVRCKVEKSLFMLRVENSADGEVYNDLSTTKKDKKLHGLGLAGMREIVSRYGGVLEAGAKDRKFELIVSIPTEIK